MGWKSLNGANNDIDDEDVAIFSAHNITLWAINVGADNTQLIIMQCWLMWPPPQSWPTLEVPIIMKHTRYI